MKTRYFLIVIMAAIFVGNVHAAIQPPSGNRQQRSPEDRAKQETEWMKKDLALTEKQVPLIDSINLVFAKKQAELRKEMEGQDREAMRPKMQELRTQKEAALKVVLTEEQMKKFAELEQQRRQNRQGGPGGPGNQPRPEGKSDAPKQ